MTDSQALPVRTLPWRRLNGWGMLFPAFVAWGAFLLLNSHAQVRCVRQHQALLVLDNVVERLSVHRKKDLDVKLIKAVLDAEFARCDLARDRGVSAVCARQGDVWCVSITDGAGGVLARVDVPSRG